MSSNTIGIVNMLRLLNEDALPLMKVAEKSGLHIQTVRKFVHLLRKDYEKRSPNEPRLIRIVEWHRLGRFNGWIPYYEWNVRSLPDVPKPKPMNGTQKTQAYRKRKTFRGMML